VQGRRDALVLEHLSLADGIARAIARSLPPSFDLDDLIATGYEALLHAATRYRPAAHNGTPFAAYARQRIRGAILDTLRAGRYAENVRPGIEFLDPEADDDGRVESDALTRIATQPGWEQEIDWARKKRRVADAMTWLPAEQRRVLALYYAPAEPTFAEVGAAMGMHEWQAIRRHHAAIRALRARLKAA
jgi:RNA polymerase sigma factor (sigma-70 family)